LVSTHTMSAITHTMMAVSHAMLATTWFFQLRRA